ncbi:hypothetical protein HH214_08765 [Mucilaginibacter robiniae]|uniref:Zinc finger CHC2-type domain-containing protein n=1 Tax=Mucilaginibacter robiniae TaxID=2728022 RepID=A0A7L5DXY2_9SPHI|nr:toprim domain-containing protein [Mucilaginibacter robiniae]QJD95960.1 hypothetical protein HH214_08765 [Mucilaginibacter robiniae]
MSVHSLVQALKAGGSLITLLDRLGYRPVREHGKEAMYLSMLRDNDTQPSFSVNDKLGVWFDHGTGKGGNIIDFGIAYWPLLSFGEVVAKLQATLSGERLLPREKRPRLAVQTPAYRVYETKPLGTHPAITAYLESRGILSAARPFLREVYYQIEDGRGGRRKYFAAGWQNELQSWEVRNRFFKGCLGPKAISFLPGHTRKLAVFEGFMDFLSWKTDHPAADHSIFVLNSATLLREGIRKAVTFPVIDLYLDRDPAGTLATREFIRRLPYAADRSDVYAGYKDYNDKRVPGLQQAAAQLSPAHPSDKPRVPPGR